MQTRTAATSLALLTCAGFVLAACPGEAPAPQRPEAPETVRRTYRVISGISMGAIGSAALGLAQPERFDAIVPLGGPLDAAYLLRMMDRLHTGGLCPLSSLEALALEDPAKLNDPSAIESCAVRPARLPYELPIDLNHWAWTPGGGFDRDSHLRLFHDLTLAFGNLFTENEASLFAPQGTDLQWMLNPPAEFCTSPVRVKGLFNREYNPAGEYDSITFCDGSRRIFYCAADRTPVDFCSDPANIAAPLEPGAEEPFAQSYCSSRGGHVIADRENHADLFLSHGARFDACRSRAAPVTVALAIDLNGNGRRDYGEPLLNNGQERFRDVGADGCPNPFEDGQGGCTSTENPTAVDPNQDDYEAFANPFGTEGDWRWSPGEPFDDDGLDGVPGTGDFGEGNSTHDLTTGRRRLYAMDARSKLRELEPKRVSRLRFLLDGGVRDLFNFGVSARQLFGLIRARHPGESGDYRQWIDIPGLRVGSRFNPWLGAWSKTPDNLFVLYGKDDPTEKDLLQGDGDHSGTTGQALDRFSMLINFADEQWPHLPRPPAPVGGPPFSERVFITSYDSALLGAKRGFGVFLPPGYHLPENAETRYPVVFMLHGYGGAPEGYLAATLIFDGHMTGEKASIRPMIVIFPSGRCCYANAQTGARDCREVEDDGRKLSTLAGWNNECSGGSFYVDHAGTGATAERPYGATFFELMDEVDRRFRTLAPEDVVIGQ